MLVFIRVLFITLCCIHSHAALPTVTIGSGILVGTTTSLPLATATVNQYLGVPFAKSPPLRFAPPETPAKWSDPLDASTRRPACVQQFSYPLAAQKISKEVFNLGSPAESEDCLYLNIYTPGGNAPEGGWPVMFWIYGGGLNFGDSSLFVYDGSSFATNQDVLIVTPNYRTNVFGFPGSPEIPVGSNNLGFLDQRKALEWVSDNIGKFGGAADKVTIFGESAGGVSVKLLMALPPSPLSFRGAIMESQAEVIFSDANTSWQKLVTRLNCSTASSQLACMRSKPATTIKDTIEMHRINFPPIVDHITYVSDVSPMITSKTFANVSFMIGTNANEGRIFSYDIGLGPEPLGSANVTSFLETTFPGQLELQALIAASYAIEEAPYLVVSDILTQLGFQCPAKKLSNLAVKNGHKVWRYYFDAPFPNLTPLPDLGVYHSSEIFEVFGTYYTENSTAQQVALSRYMQTAWANFAKNPTNGPGWAGLGSNSKDVANLGGDGNFGEVDITQESIDYKCPLYAAVIDTGII